MKKKKLLTMFSSFVLTLINGSVCKKNFTKYERLLIYWSWSQTQHLYWFSFATFKNFFPFLLSGWSWPVVAKFLYPLLSCHSLVLRHFVWIIVRESNISAFPYYPDFGVVGASWRTSPPLARPPSCRRWVSLRGPTRHLGQMIQPNSWPPSSRR